VSAALCIRERKDGDTSMRAGSSWYHRNMVYIYLEYTEVF
jgi:hypothetical protein